MERIVLLGTSTHVGKTYVGCALSRALAERGSPVRSLKPVESGADTDFVDARQLAQADGSGKFDPPLYGFRAPLSPHLAARREGREISLEAVAAWTRERAPERGWCLVETAGGVLTPLGTGITNFDLARALEPAIWLLVAPDALGVLGAITSTLVALRALGRSPDLCVLSTPDEPDASTGTNADELERLKIVSVTASFPRALTAERDAATRLADAVVRMCECA